MDGWMEGRRPSLIRRRAPPHAGGRRPPQGGIGALLGKRGRAPRGRRCLPPLQLRPAMEAVRRVSGPGGAGLREKAIERETGRPPAISSCDEGEKPAAGRRGRPCFWPTPFRGAGRTRPSHRRPPGRRVPPPPPHRRPAGRPVRLRRPDNNRSAARVREDARRACASGRRRSGEASAEPASGVRRPVASGRPVASSAVCVDRPWSIIISGVLSADGSVVGTTVVASCARARSFSRDLPVGGRLHSVGPT